MSTEQTAWDPWNYGDVNGYDPEHNTIVGFHVEATDGSIGKIDEATAEVGDSYLVVDTGPWIFGSRVLLPAGIIAEVDTHQKKVYVSRTKDQIKDAPPYVDDHHGDPNYFASLGSYYGGGLGGMFGGLGGMPMMPPPEVAAGEEPAEHPTRDDVHDHAATTVVTNPHGQL